MIAQFVATLIMSLVFGGFGYLIGAESGQRAANAECDAKHDVFVKKVEQIAKAKGLCEHRLHSLFYGRCDVAAPPTCELAWGEMVEAGGRAIGVHGIGPAECPVAADVPWVRPGSEEDGNEWSFICAPPPARKDP